MIALKPCCHRSVKHNEMVRLRCSLKESPLIRGLVCLLVVSLRCVSFVYVMTVCVGFVYVMAVCVGCVCIGCVRWLFLLVVYVGFVCWFFIVGCVCFIHVLFIKHNLLVAYIDHTHFSLTGWLCELCVVHEMALRSIPSKFRFNCFCHWQCGTCWRE